MEWFEKNAESLCGAFGISLPHKTEHYPGERSDVLKLSCPEGAYALRRLHFTIGADGAEFIHRATRAISADVPEALCNLETTGGEGYIILDGRIVTLCPWISGEALPYNVERKRDVASLMGRMHKASLNNAPKNIRSDRPPFCQLPSEKNYIFDIEGIRHVLYEDCSRMKADNPDKESEVEYIISKRDDIIRWHEEAFKFYTGVREAFPEMVKAPIHADIYDANIIWENGRIASLIDWDECKLESLCYELSRALWEIAGIPDDDIKNLTDVQDFIREYYKAGGVVPKWELKYAFGFIRSIRTFDLLQYIYCSLIGDYYSVGYMLKNIHALDNLPYSMDLDQLSDTDP